MPWTLYRFIATELLKLLLLSSAVLVLVISFAAAIKPLSEGLLEPITLIKFVLYSIPTILALVVPFAAAFAGTLLFSRMATDNEITACASSGMSYRSILLPVFFLGLVLTISLYYLSNWVVPWFFRQTAIMVEQDLTTEVIRKVGDGRAMAIPGTKGHYLWAEDSAQVDPDAETSDGSLVPHKLIMLRGVVLGKFGTDGVLRDQHAAQKADIFLYRDGSGSWATVRLQNVISYKRVTDTFDLTVSDLTLGPFLLPDPFRDEPRFLSWPALIRLSKQPERYSRVARRQKALAGTMARHRLLAGLENELDTATGPGQAHLEADRHHEHDKYVLSAPRVQRRGARLQLAGAPDQPVRVEVYARNLLAYEIEAPSAFISVSSIDPESEPLIEIVLDDATIMDKRDTSRHPGHRETFKIRRARWPADEMKALLRFSPGHLLIQARDYGDSDTVKRSAVALSEILQKLTRQIIAQLHERYALSVISMLVLLLGAVLSMKLRGSMPLVIYFWTFLLASVAVFITRSGENLATKIDYSPWVGLSILWLGVILLCGAIGTIYWRLARN